MNFSHTGGKMKSLRTLTIAGFLLSIALLPAVAETITAADVKNHIGEQATVCGTVASEKTAMSSRGEPTFINLDSAYPNQIFTILAWWTTGRTSGREDLNL